MGGFWIKNAFINCPPHVLEETAEYTGVHLGNFMGGVKNNTRLFHDEVPKIEPDCVSLLGVQFKRTRIAAMEVGGRVRLS